jgi:hypothetical protein
MIANAALGGKLRLLTLVVALWAPRLALFGFEATVTRTNWSDRWITNVIQVTIPTNRYVNAYHTNWTMQTITNPVEVRAVWTNVVVAYYTNWTTRTRTNTVSVGATHTNFVTRYQTNWSTLTLTNLLTRYQTNWTTLNLTNWEAVVMLRTNWVTLPVTNVVQIDVATRPAAPAAAARQVVAPKPAVAEPSSTAPVAAWSGPLVIEASRTTQSSANGLVEMQIRVRWNDSRTAPLQVLSWRIEGENGAVFLFGQEQEFKPQLPAGNYKVEVRLKGEADAPTRAVRGTLSVTTREVTVEPRLLVRK